MSSTGFLCGYISGGLFVRLVRGVLEHEKWGEEMGKKGSITGGYRRLATGCDGNDDGGGDRAVPKGYVPMLVGSGRERERFLVHRKRFGHPQFAVLLEMAASEFGYEQEGILKIPCELDYFERVVEQVSKNK